MIKDSAFSFDIDISAAGELAMKLNSFGVMDIDVGAMHSLIYLSIYFLYLLFRFIPR